VGPINRFESFKRDLRRRRWDTELFSGGLERILFGYFKVVVLANFLISIWLRNYAAMFSGNVISKAYMDAAVSWMNLYIQFSGYSDIAIGFSALAGFRIIENFNYPFLATNILEFWQRWHISLTSWCRDYVYKPVLSFTRKPFLSICFTMIVIGLWHEVSLRYLLWGLYHSLGITVYLLIRKTCIKEGGKYGRLTVIAGRFSGWFITMNFVILSYPITKYINDQLNIYWREFLKCIFS
jgi:D-alanyl-lipoteichoic acid acyltransferase DltB (MBOAT superfamily)